MLYSSAESVVSHTAGLLRNSRDISAQTIIHRAFSPPLIDGGDNIYRYVGNNPLNNIDPSGLDSITMHNIPEAAVARARMNTTNQTRTVNKELNPASAFFGGILNFVGNLTEGVVQNAGRLLTFQEKPDAVLRAALDLPFDVISGDMLDASKYNTFKHIPKNANEIIVTINGIYNTPEDAKAILDSIKSFPNVSARTAVVNNTHFRIGNTSLAGDTLGQILPNELGLIDGVAIRLANQIIMADRALHHAGTTDPTIRVVAHSQGGMVLQRALDYIAARPDGKRILAEMAVYTNGAERFISDQRGLKSVVNFVTEFDPVPMIGNPTIARKLEDDVAGNKTYHIVIVPGATPTKDDPWAPHHWDSKNYEKIYSNPATLSAFSAGIAPGSKTAPDIGWYIQHRKSQTH